jgi:hypothetical protein
VRLVEAKLSVKLMDALESWKMTGRLPNGEFWMPSMGIKYKRLPFEMRMYMSSRGVPLSDFYRVVCSKACINKRAAQLTLFYLRDLGMIEINWHSKHGPLLYPIRARKSKARHFRAMRP